MKWDKFVEMTEQTQQSKAEQSKAQQQRIISKQRTIEQRTREKMDTCKTEVETAIVDNIAIKATRIVLKQIVDRSSDDRIRILRGLFENDLASVDNLTKRLEVEAGHGKLNKAETLSDAIDLLQVARTETLKYLLQGKNAKSLVYTVKRRYWDASRTDAPYTQLKVVTVFSAVMSAVNKEIYRFKGLTTCNSTKRIKTDDGKIKTVETVSERIFYDAFGDDTGSCRERVYKSVNASTWQDMDYGEMDDMRETVKLLKLNEREMLILTLRMRGYNIDEIAKRMTVGSTAIYNTLYRLQKRAVDTVPQKIRQYQTA